VLTSNQQKGVCLCRSDGRTDNFRLAHTRNEAAILTRSIPIRRENSEIISTRGPQLFGAFFAEDNIKGNGHRASRKDLLSPAR
jgi:hypothetical protein